MNKSVTKFITIVEELIEKSFISILESETVEKIRVARIANSIEGFRLWLNDDYHLEGKRVISSDILLINSIFNNIHQTPELGIKLKEKDMVNTLLYYFEKNIKNGILIENIEIIPITQAKDLNIKSLDEIDTASQIKKNKRSRELLSKDYKQKDNEVFLLTEYSPQLMPGIIALHKIIKEFYFDKIDEFTQEDIEVVACSVSASGIDDYIADAVHNYLQMKLQKRIESEERKKSETKKVAKVQRIQKPILTKKEYHEIKDELDSKFDFERMEPRIDVTLTPEEIAHCIDLMNQLSFTYREKEIFLEKSFKKSKEELLNIDSIMNLLQNQIEFYNINSEIVNKAMENLELYIEEYKNVEDIIEKEEWYELIKEEIQIVNTFIPRTFEYEKKLLLQK